MAEKSGIEILDNINSRIDLIEKRFTNVEQMMKELLNRANTIKDLRPTISSEAKIDTGVKIETPSVKTEDTIKIGDPSVITPPNQKIKVLGQIKNKEGRYVSGALVKIFNESSQVIKETKTNKAGEWMCLLPAGKYKAEYFLKDIVSGNVSFNALLGQTLLRVAQQTGD